MIDAAFGEAPDLPVTAIPPDPESRWLAAVALGGQGHYARAAVLLTGLLGGERASLAASTLASHRRQLGGHAPARALDALALSSAPPADSEARCDALLGLAADALGLRRLAQAWRLIELAGRLDAGWRAEIRIRWVRAEVELGAGNPECAVRHAEEAAERARACGSVRHRVKSGMILGAALAAGDGERACKLLSATAGEASERGLVPLLWPCALLLAELEPRFAREHRRVAGDALRCVIRRADPIGRRIARRSPWVPDPAGLTG